MTSLTCPKCRHGLADDALDAGHCPLCGFPFDGPVVLATPVSRAGGTRLLLAGGATLLLTTAVAGFAVFGGGGDRITQPAIEVAAVPPAEPVVAVLERQVAPFPHEPQHTDANPPTPPVGPPGIPGDPGPPPVVPPPVKGDMGPPPGPVVVEPPKKVAPRPIGVVMKVDPRIAPKRHFDHPDDTAALSDLNSGDRVTLTGKVRVLRLGSVNGKGVLDASRLVAEEIVITGDLNNESQVLLNAPNGTVMVGGYVTGASKLTIAAPGGEVTIAGSGRLSGGPLVTVTAKRLEVKCPMSGNARVNVTLTAPGSLKLGLMEESATVTYKKAAANDPPPTIEKGNIRGGAKVIAGN